MSNEYSGTMEKLQWECSFGHVWEAIPSNILKGSWCPECAAGIGERICRTFFEQLFRQPFPKARPDWLRSPEGHQLELDGCSVELKVAFEHHGLQHFQQDNYWIKEDDVLARRVALDDLKIDLCRQQGIRVIEVLSIPSLLPVHQVKEYIRHECEAQGVNLPPSFYETEVDLHSAYSYSDQNKLDELKQLAKERQGQLLSETYSGTAVNHLWQCEKKHQWEAMPSNIKTGTWCPKCATDKRKEKLRKYVLGDMKKIAEERGGKCLSDAFNTTRQKLIWQCNKGHTWEAIPDTVVNRGSWCPTCYKERSKK